MNINRLLRSYGYIYPRNVSYENLLFLHNLKCIPIYLVRLSGRWTYDIDFFPKDHDRQVAFRSLACSDIKYIFKTIDDYLKLNAICFHNPISKNLIMYVLITNIRFYPAKSNDDK